MAFFVELPNREGDNFLLNIDEVSSIVDAGHTCDVHLKDNSTEIIRMDYESLKRLLKINNLAATRY